MARSEACGRIAMRVLRKTRACPRQGVRGRACVEPQRPGRRPRQRLHRPVSGPSSRAAETGPWGQGCVGTRLTLHLATCKPTPTECDAACPAPTLWVTRHPERRLSALISPSLFPLPLHKCTGSAFFRKSTEGLTTQSPSVHPTHSDARRPVPGVWGRRGSRTGPRAPRGPMAAGGGAHTDSHRRDPFPTVPALLRAVLVLSQKGVHPGAEPPRPAQHPLLRWLLPGLGQPRVGEPQHEQPSAPLHRLPR